MSGINALNDCGKANPHTPEWEVSMTSPRGDTGVTILKCTPCVLKILETPAVQDGGRTVHLKRVDGDE